MRNTFLTLVILCSLVSCDSVRSSLSSNLIDELSENDWILQTLYDKDVVSDDYMKGLPELEFLEEGTVRGSTGCNSFKGTFLLKDQNLTIDPGAMTKMKCPGDGEAEFLKALNSITGVKMEDETLVLMGGAEEVMKLIPQKENK